MSDRPRLSRADMHRQAASAIRKIDVWGARGTTLCSIDEIEAMACLIIANRLLADMYETHDTHVSQKGND
ncbi:MAG: hypothetical protein AAF755_10245 [Pseudomonadota bacterium]